MATDKHTPFESKLESILKDIDGRIHEIRAIVTGMHDQITELAETTDAVYKNVSNHTNHLDPTYVPDDDWDFLDEED